MIKKLSYLITENKVPYENLAIEEFLTFHVEKGECILFLWQNRHTVVIGKNQNCYKECKVDMLEEDGGYLARRSSGGGAVFHDLGNLNFSFCVRKEDYDVKRQLLVICKAVGKFGVKAEISGRNDIIVEGRKISGNAFLESGDFCCHHGTVLLDVNKSDMSKYLQVSKEKLALKGVDSVKSRVANLMDFYPQVTVPMMEEKLVQAFSEVYEGTASLVLQTRIDKEEVKQITEKYASWEWKYGRKIPFDYEMAKRFGWGEIVLQFSVNEGKIQNVQVYSDAMDQEFIGEIQGMLSGNRYIKAEMINALKNKATTGSQVIIIEDICRMISEKF